MRRTVSRRPLAAWEPLIMHGGRELPTSEPQTVTDALEYRGRYRGYPGAIVGMKPPQYAVWAFQQLGARPGDELVDLYPGSGAVSEAWQRYTAMPSTSDTSPPAAAAGDARADRDTSRTPAGREVLSDPSRPGDDTRTDLTSFDDAGRATCRPRSRSAAPA